MNTDGILSDIRDSIMRQELSAEEKREERRAQFACAAMQGLITRGLFDADPKGAATEALYFADALLAAIPPGQRCGGCQKAIECNIRGVAISDMLNFGATEDDRRVVVDRDFGCTLWKAKP